MYPIRISLGRGDADEDTDEDDHDIRLPTPSPRKRIRKRRSRDDGDHPSAKRRLQTNKMKVLFCTLSMATLYVVSWERINSIQKYLCFRKNILLSIFFTFLTFNPQSHLNFTYMVYGSFYKKSLVLLYTFWCHISFRMFLLFKFVNNGIFLFNLANSYHDILF